MKPHRKKFLSARAVWLAAVLALFAFNGIGRAQTNAGGGRWLLVFDASSTMKKRLPGTEAAVRRFFSARAEGQLKDGDSIGVWAFDQQIDGRFPAFDWTADGSAESVSNLLAYLRGQRYRTDSKIGILAAPLDHVVAVSSNLTILIFCDGQSELVGTPYNLGVNKIFQSSRAERKKTASRSC